MNVSGDAPHHIMAGGHHRDRFFYRVHMGKGTGQFQDSRQATLQHVLPEVVQFQHDVITVRAAAAPLDNFQHHGAGNHITTGQVLGVGRVALHKSLAILVNQVAAFTAASLRHQGAGTCDARGVKLPHLNILHRKASTQCHANTVAGIDVSVSGGGVNPPRPACGKNRGLGLNVNRFARFDADGDYTNHSTVLVLHQVSGKPLVKEYSVVLHVALVQRVQQCVAGAVCRSTGTRCLAALAIILGLATEGPLVDAAFFSTGKR